ncbi:MAG TPA: ABC transporter ATP-binding protein [Solirubrobacteraceae bacterium]|nr:ABC transporter ATP-binding protein [Solirubrobacteraceae bacterium]
MTDLADSLAGLAAGGPRDWVARLRRVAGLLVGTGFRAAPSLAWGALGLSTVGGVAITCYSLGYRMLVDGALRHQTGRVALGAALIAVLFTAGWLSTVLAAMLGSELTDRATLTLGLRIGRLTASVPGIEHLERPDMLVHVEPLREHRRTLAAAPNQLFSLWGSAIRSVGVVVLLATVYLPILVVPAFALLPAFADRRAARIQARGDDELAEDRRLVEELFTLATTAASARELRTYGITGALADRHAELTERTRRRSLAIARRSAAWEAAGWIGFAIGFVGAIVILVLRAAHGEQTPGQVVMSVSLLRRAQTQISRSTSSAGNFATALRTAQHLLWLEDHARLGPPRPPAQPPRAAPSPSRPAIAPPPAEPRRPRDVPGHLNDAIALQGIGFRYPGRDASVLADLDLRLTAGSVVALVGENGAGKSTVVKLLCGMYAPTAGRILVDGIPLAELDPALWRARIAATLQDYERFMLPAGQSVGVGDLRRLDDDAAIRGALDAAGAENLLDGLPDGLATQVGNRFTGGRELSGGQWQRIALARGLMRPDPLLVILDEPTASLDPVSEAALFARFANAARRARARTGAVTLLVSHRLSTARIADRIVVLNAGRVIEVGSHDELIAAAGTYAELFALQARGYSPTPR